MPEDKPDRICGQLTNSDRYCDEALGDCPYHDPPGPSVDVSELLEDALGYHNSGDHEYAEKFVRQAHDAL